MKLKPFHKLKFNNKKGEEALGTKPPKCSQFLSPLKHEV